MKIFHLITLAVIATTFLSFAKAESANFFYIEQALDRYFSLPQDTRSLALGGAYGALCVDSTCTYQNPAGLGFLQTYEGLVSLSSRSTKGDEFLRETKILQVEDGGDGVVAIPLGERSAYGTVALGYSRYLGRTDDILKTTPDGHRRTIAYGLAVSDSFSFGYSLHFYDDELRTDLSDLHSHARFLHVLGFNASFDSGFSLGGMAELGVGQSDTEDFSLKSDGLSRPKQMTIAGTIAKDFGVFRTFVGADVTSLDSEGNLDKVSQPVVIGGNEAGTAYNMRLGVEGEVFDRLDLRAGTRLFVAAYDFDRRDLQSLSGTIVGSGWSGGLGYLLPYTKESAVRWNLSYGGEYLQLGHGSWRHLIGVRITQNS